MTLKNKSKRLTGGLAGRLIIYILLFSSVITLIGTAVQLYINYIRDVDSIESVLDIIDTTHLEPITHNLWVSDIEQLEIHLEGLTQMPDMQYLAIIKEGRTILAKGRRPDKHYIQRTYPLNYRFHGRQVHLGTLHAYADLGGIYKHLIDLVLVILVTQGVKTFLVTFFMFVIFYWLVGRHLEKLARYTKKMSLDNLDQAISLDRKKKKKASPDELDTVVNAINNMRSNLLQDIEARRQAEEALRGSEKLLSAIIEGTSDCIFVKDMQRRYVLVNEATARAVGRSKEEIRGKTDDELFSEDTAELIRNSDSQVMESGEPRLFEERLGTSFGDSYWLANKNPLKDENGRVTGLVGISRNITAIKQVEKEKEQLETRLRQAQKMEAIGTLAGGIAHDFNNILSIIIGYSELAKEDAPPDSEYARELDGVIEAGNRAKELVKQILAFSRQADIERIPLQMQSLVKEALKMMRASIPATIEIRENIDSRCGAVLADPTQVQQILMNLCTNALHAMEETGGVITVELLSTGFNMKQRPAPDMKPGRYVELKVSDTGPGIAPEIRDKIFNPYFTTKEINKGTGLGLSIIHGIIAGYQGAVTLESQPGEGSTFHVYFPEMDKEDLQMLEEIEEAPAGRGRVLFVDDEKLLTEMGREMLERLGYTVTVRNNSVDALTTFQNDPGAFDVVITDQTMPGLTGSELAMKMLRIRPDIPIILCTGYSSMIDEESAKLIGIKEFAMKPLTRTEIARLLRKVLG